MTYPHYIFGYGSLICPASRAVTAPTLRNRLATPARVRDLERTWSFPVPQCSMTFMGIRRQENATCVGVLIPVNDEELAQFDARELGYDRIPLEYKAIEKLSETTTTTTLATKKHQGGISSCFFERLEQTAHRNDDNEYNKPKVWVYLQQWPSPVNPQCPLAQTYIDIIMRGCLTISPDFLQEFLQTTRGWSAHDLDDDDDDLATSLGKQQVLSATYWIDDRHDPLYARADKEYSQTKGVELDSWLKKHRPEIAHRKPLQ